MSLYSEEKAFIETVRKKLNKNKQLDAATAAELLSRFEDMMEMTGVTVKIIDRLMLNHQQLQKELNSKG